MASNIPILSNIYKTLGLYNEYKDYSTYIGQSIKVSKYTYTIDSIIVTPYKSLIAIKITSTEPIPEDHEGFIITPSIGGVHCNSSDSSQDYRIDDYNIVTTIEHNYVNKVPKKSTIKIDIMSCDSRERGTDSHGTFEFKADFDRSYTEFISLPVKNANIDKFGVKVKEIDSSIMGTKIVSEGDDEDTIRIHYKGKTSDIIPLCDINAWYKGIIKGNFSKVILNPNNENDFTLEFNNVPTDKKIDLSFLDMDHIVNSFTLLDKVKIK